MKRWRILAGASAAAVAAGGVIVLLAPGSHQPPSLPRAASSEVPAAPAQSAPPAAAAAQVVPIRVIIPAIGVNAAIEPVGTCPTTRLDESCSGQVTGGVATPPLSGPLANDVGWWSGGYAPGQDGPAVLAGHVDSAAAGNLVFANLDKVVAGESIEVEPGNLWFTVTGTQEVSKDAFPTQAVYGATQGPALRLITCGGGFDAATGHYIDNFIVYAQLATPSG